MERYLVRKNTTKRTISTVIQHCSREIGYGGSSTYVYPPNVSWRRDLFGDKLVMWNNLLSRLTTVVSSQEEDEFIWTLDRKGEFSVKSHYLGLIHQNIPNTNKHLWKLKTSLKIKVFLWYLRKGVILTKDNLAKRNWQGNQQCCFCHENEMIQHLFFDCRFARLVWATTVCMICLGTD